MTDFQAALVEAKAAAQATYAKIGEADCCGFAWVKAPNVKMNTKEGKALKALGFERIWTPEKGAYLWNPAKFPTQSMTVHEDGARAYATGLEFYAASRMD
jgi:hypothetical protein